MNRRSFLQYSLLGGAAALARPGLSSAGNPRTKFSANAAAFELEEVTIMQLQEGMKAGKWTARSIAEKYLKRIRDLDQQGAAVNSIIELNPEALSIADALDRERKSKVVRGALHGIPLLLKDNIDTADRMQTTAGSLALVGSAPARDAHIAERLRAAGAVILGKTNLSEWANFRSTHSTSGWSGRGGQTRNPYALDRNPCGSSSGSGAAVAANFAAVAVGTETDGSIVCPSSSNSIVGIKPSIGIVSRSGIIPISHSQDTAGPMARTVTDAAILLNALAGFDSRDDAMKGTSGRIVIDYTKSLNPDGLRGARIGVARKFFGFNDRVDKLMSEAIDAMKRQGAIIVDPAEIATSGKFDDSEFEVLLFEFKADLNKYLMERGTKAPARSLKELIEFNEQNREREMPFFGQEIFIKAEAKGALTSKEYRDALSKNGRMSRSEGIDAVMNKHKLDALIAPTGGPPWTTDLINGDHFSGGSSTPAAVAGYPNINVPAGFVYGLPVGISFFGRLYSEPILIKLAYAFEQATMLRQPPRFLTSNELHA